ncbi:hypothetical protein GCM10023093_00740 [Nemorincola caseinilytica]|uniref:Uncharacterized protein n=1 Tax=Nemorincola caseinilytica TaxID=2054315 RepID=A0ABP8N1A8_9BACT
MKAYSKKLRSVAELEQERRRLLQEKELLEEQGLLSMDDVVDSIGSSGLLGGKLPFIMNIASRIAPFAGTIAGPLVSMAQQWLSSATEEKDDDDTTTTKKNKPTPEGKKSPSRAKKVLWAAGKEFLGSYLKWKAMQLSYKGVKLIVKKQKEKKARQAATEQK